MKIQNGSPLSYDTFKSSKTSNEWKPTVAFSTDVPIS